MKIQTKEFCERCPHFDGKLGWKDSDDVYWKEHTDIRCTCAECSLKSFCETKGPRKSVVECCVVLFSENHLDRRGLEYILRWLESQEKVNYSLLKEELGRISSLRKVV